MSAPDFFEAETDVHIRSPQRELQSEPCLREVGVHKDPRRRPSLKEEPCVLAVRNMVGLRYSFEAHGMMDCAFDAQGIEGRP